MPGAAASTRVVTPLPYPMTRAEAEHDLRSHVAAIGGVHLPVHPQRAPRFAVPHTDGRVPALAKGQLAYAAMVEVCALLRRVHAAARVDRGSEVDEPGAPPRRGDGDDERDGREHPCAEHADAQAPVLDRPLGNAPRRRPGERQRGQSIENEADPQRRLRAPRDDEYEAG